jgi:hypothetical protein
MPRTHAASWRAPLHLQVGPAGPAGHSWPHKAAFNGKPLRFATRPSLHASTALAFTASPPAPTCRRVVTASVVWLEDREAQRQGATALTSAALAAAAVAAGAGPQAAAAPAAPGGKAQGAAGPGGHVPTGGDSGRRHGQLAKLQLSPLPQDIHTPPPWRRSPSPSPGARRIVSRSPSPGIRSLLAGRRSRASRSPPLPVSTSVQQAGGTPRLLNSDDGSGGAGWHSPTGRSGATSSSSSAMYERSIEVLTSVFRAGLAGAKTDHVR